MLRVDDHGRLDTWRDIELADHADPSGPSQGRAYRLGLTLFLSLGARHQAICGAGRVFDLIPQPADLHRELDDFFEILSDRIRTVSEPLDANGEVPLASHATHSLGEIVAAYRFLDKKGALHLPQTGVL